MSKRTMIALGAALVFVGATCAQEPPGPPPEWTEGPAPSLAPSCAGDGAGPNSEEQSWATVDYLLGWIKSTHLPPLVTTSPAGTPQASAGVLGKSTTQTLFGGDTENGDVRSGFRFETGCWFSPDHVLGVEAGGMLLESQSKDFAASSTGTPILARPFINANNNTQQSVLVAFPGVSSGSVDVQSASGNFYEAHVDLTENVFDGGWVRVNPLLGYRFFRYDEALLVRQTINPTGANFVAGTRIDTVDDFSSQNEFHGGDFGLRTQFIWQSLSLDLVGRLAVGDLRRSVAIKGNQEVTVPGSAPVVKTGGVLALSSNIGTHNSDDWTVLPEFGLGLNWQVYPHLRLGLGYSVLFLPEVARAADQVDPTVNPNLFPTAVQPASGPNRPAFNLGKQDIWVQGLSMGLEFTY